MKRKVRRGIISMVFLLTGILLWATDTKAETIKGELGEEIYCSYDTETKVLQITGTGQMNDYLDISVPWEQYKEEVKEIQIQEGITNIGDSIFTEMFNVEKVDIPDSVTEIGKRAFWNCQSLKSIDLPDQLQSIGDSAFINCSTLTRVTLPEHATELGKEVFYSCDNLEDITFPSQITEIPSKFLNSCDNLKKIDIPKHVTKIGAYSFAGCSSLQEIKIPDTVTEIGGEEGGTFSGCGSLTEIEIPEKVTVIPKHTFSVCRKLSKVVLPDGVEKIGDFAFQHCEELKDFVLPANVKTIGMGIFAHCANMTEVVLSDENSNFQTLNGVLYNKAGSSIIVYPPGKMDTSYEILSSVTDIGAGAFYTCGNLVNVTIPEKVKTIGTMAFYECNALREIDIPDQVEEIGQNAFDESRGMMNISVSEGNVNYASYKGILYNKDRTELLFCPDGYYGTVTVHENAKKIEDQAFASCQNITEVILPEELTTIGDGAFKVCAKLVTINIPSSVKTIGEEAFCLCTNLPEIRIPGSVKEIGYGTFSQCESLMDVTLEKGVITIEDDVFSYCDSLQSIVFPEGMNHIGVHAFYDCNHLSKAYFEGDAPEEVMDYAFYNCADDFAIYYRKEKKGWTSPTWLGYPTKIWEVEEEEFPLQGECGEDVYWFLDKETGVLTISGNGYWKARTPGDHYWRHYYDAIKKVVVKEGIEEIPDYALDGCVNLTEVVLPNGLKRIDYQAFAALKLESITIPKSVEYIGERAFCGDAHLTSVYFPGKISEEIEEDAFGEVTATVYYSKEDNTATEALRQNYGGNLTWKPYTIRKKQTIKASSYTKTYGSKAFSLGAKTSGDGKLTYTSGNKKIATVSSKGNVTIKGYGSVTITIKAAQTEHYLAASKKITIKVIPKKASIKSVTSPGKKKIKITWSKNSTVTGYQIYLSTRKDFKKNVVSRSYGKSTGTKTLSGWKSKTTYYIKIRSYKTVGKTKCYGAWSSIKSVKVK